MRAVDQVIHQRLSSDVALINQLSHYIVNSGGKRLRPLLAVLSAKVFGYQGNMHYLQAAIIEFIHTATLLQDGRVLVAGGYGSSGVLERSELYDPITRAWSQTSNFLNYRRRNHTATLPPGGQVVVVGG